METWKSVVGYEGRYEVSDHGSVRSLDRWVRARLGRRLVRGQPLKPKPVKGGYLVVTLFIEQARSIRTIHSLVLEAFVEPRPAGMEACHGAGGPANNRVENLRWGTRQSNHDDKKAQGTAARGERVNTARLTASQVLAMRNERAAGGKVEDLAVRYGVSSTAVSKICVGDTWTHVGGPLVPRQERRRAA